MHAVHDFPLDVWREVIKHVRNRDHMAVASVGRNAHAAVRTSPLTFDQHLDAASTVCLLARSAVPLHAFVHRDVSYALSTRAPHDAYHAARDVVDRDAAHAPEDVVR